MGKNIGQLYSVVIAQSASASEELGPEDLRDADGLCIYLPATMTGTAVEVEVSFDGSTWFSLQTGISSTTDTPYAEAPGEALQIGTVNFPYLRLLSNGTEAAARTIYVTKGVIDSRLV